MTKSTVIWLLPSHTDPATHYWKISLPKIELTWLWPSHTDPATHNWKISLPKLNCFINLLKVATCYFPTCIYFPTSLPFLTLHLNWFALFLALDPSQFSYFTSIKFSLSIAWCLSKSNQHFIYFSHIIFITTHTCTHPHIHIGNTCMCTMCIYTTCAYTHIHMITHAHTHFQLYVQTLLAPCIMNQVSPCYNLFDWIDKTNHPQNNSKWLRNVGIGSFLPGLGMAGDKVVLWEGSVHLNRAVVWSTSWQSSLYVTS